MKSTNITAFASSVPDGVRYRVTLPHILWLTGLSASGKSTVGSALEAQLHSLGYNAAMLDGDNVRHGLCGNLGFSEADRAENIRRISEAAILCAKMGYVVIVTVISPSADTRAAAKESAVNAGVPFDEVYVCADVQLCSKRDPKGLYKRAFAGEISNFTGVDAPYDVPQSPDITLYTGALTVGESVDILTRAVLAIQLPLVPMLKTAVDAALESGVKIMEIYSRDFAVEYKDDKSPLTEADKAASEIITSRLRESYPYAAVLCEETADKAGDDGVPARLNYRRCFIVDPVDGTVEFIKRNGEFTVNIALADNHRAVMGVVYVPVGDTLYYAAEGYGAFKVEGASAGFTYFDECQRIKVSERSDGLIVTVSRSHPDSETTELLGKSENAVRIAAELPIGSSLKGCRIAEGFADVHYRFGPYTKEWDTAAMQCVCEQAGAIFRQNDRFDSPMLYNRTDVRNQTGFYIVNRVESKLIK